MKALTWNETCFYVNGNPTPLICGEFHYFRVPKTAWRERLLLLRESGANAVATYIPWIIHEPREGEILFDDIPERSLTAFLELCCELELMVIARPGPHSYSELCYDGLPSWLAKQYPEVRSHGPNSTPTDDMYRISYLHPVFLEKARNYIRAVDAKIKPYLASNGGCIVSVQADNEIGGIHIWYGYLDCNAQAMGFGQADGHYVRFLQNKYGSIELLNTRYETAYHDFTEILPFQNTPKDSVVGGKRFANDYHAFYKWTLEHYIQTLCAWFEEDGLDVDFCTNAGSPSLLPIMHDIPEKNRKHHLLLGVDHYYALFPNAGICMTPEKAVKYQYSLDMLEALGMPPSVLEMQSGSASCYPPILPENLHGFYMTHVAFGMKGSNYYVFTGGPNFENTGNNTAIYDYHAPVSATGEIRPIYHVQKERNLYSHQNTDLLTVPRSYDVQLGFNWDMAMLSGSGPWSRYSRDGISMSKYTASLQLTLALSGRLLHTCEIGKEPELSAPLVVVSDQRMAKEKQENLIRFVQRGGKLLLTPMVPEYDEDFVPCTLLRDFLGITETERIGGESPAVLESGEKVYGLQYKYCAHGFAGQVLGSNESDGKALIEYKQIGSGAVAVMGAVYDYSQFCQMDMLELCLQKLGGVRQVESDSRNLMVTLFECEGRSVCFLLNLLAGAVTATLRIRANGKWHTLEHITVPAQAVMPIELLSDEEIF